MKRSAAVKVVACSVVLVGGCTDAPHSTSPTVMQAVTELPASLQSFEEKIQDVPALTVDLPTQPRPWDSEPEALAEAIRAGDGIAIVAFKSPAGERLASQRGATGVRGSVSKSDAVAGLTLLDSSGVEVLDYLGFIGAAKVRITPDVAVEIAQLPNIDYVEPRRTLTLMSAWPADDATLPRQSIPWGISKIGATSAWQKTTGGGASILVIDSGVDDGHVDLPDLPAANCDGAPGGGCIANNFHGTHVLGIAAARLNAFGVVGVARGVYNSDVYSWAACNAARACNSDEIIDGIYAAVTWDIDVVNMSLGSTTQNLDMANAVSAANAATRILNIGVSSLFGAMISGVGKKGK